MSREELVAKLYEYVASTYGVDESTLSEDTVLADLGVGSKYSVAMCASIENDFDVMIPVARFGKYKTIGEVADFVEEEM